MMQGLQYWNHVQIDAYAVKVFNTLQTRGTIQNVNNEQRVHPYKAGERSLFLIW
jgi:hypothetical protein